MCTCTVVHERGNSLLVHCFVAVLYSEYVSECEVTGSQCLSQQTVLLPFFIRNMVVNVK
jgi:hypothetical protein